jgi:hypothetical protein
MVLFLDLHPWVLVGCCNWGGHSGVELWLIVKGSVLLWLLVPWLEQSWLLVMF